MLNFRNNLVKKKLIKLKIFFKLKFNYRDKNMKNIIKSLIIIKNKLNEIIEKAPRRNNRRQKNLKCSWLLL